MTKVKFHDLQFEPYIGASDIQSATKRIAAQIDKDYAQYTNQPLMLVTLNGAMLWASQLIAELNVDFEWAFTKCSSYGSGIKSSNNIILQVPPTIELKGRDVLVVEDVIDTGNTWEFLHKYAMEQGASSVRIATMTFKPEVYTKPLALDYVALTVENKFIIGNGLDYNQQGRNLRDLYTLCK